MEQEKVLEQSVIVVEKKQSAKDRMKAYAEKLQFSKNKESEE